MSVNKIIKAINEAPITYDSYFQDCSKLRILYNNCYYYGTAVCAPEDEEFSSKLVGYNIAHSRAKLEALDTEIFKAKTEYQYIKKLYYDITYRKNPEEVDPTGRLKIKMYRAENKYNNLRKAKKELRENLRKYIADQNKVIESLKRQREAKMDKNN